MFIPPKDKGKISVWKGQTLIPLCKEAATALHVKKLEKGVRILHRSLMLFHLLLSTFSCFPKCLTSSFSLVYCRFLGVCRDWERHLQRAQQVDLTQGVSASKLLIDTKRPFGERPGAHNRFPKQCEARPENREKPLIRG